MGNPRHTLGNNGSKRIAHKWSCSAVSQAHPSRRIQTNRRTRRLDLIEQHELSTELQLESQPRWIQIRSDVALRMMLGIEYRWLPEAKARPIELVPLVRRLSS